MNKKNRSSSMFLIIFILAFVFCWLFQQNLAHGEEEWPVEKTLRYTSTRNDPPMQYGFGTEKFYLINGKSIPGEITKRESDTIYIENLELSHKLDGYIPSLFSGIKGDTESYYKLKYFKTMQVPLLKTIYEMYTLEIMVPPRIIMYIEGASPLVAIFWAAGLGWSLPFGHMYTEDYGIVMDICLGMKIGGLGVAFLSALSGMSLEMTTVDNSPKTGIWVGVGLIAGSWLLDIIDAPFSAMRHNDILRKKYNLPVGISVKPEKKEVKLSYKFEF